MTTRTSWVAALLLAGLAACSSSTPNATCADFCGSGNLYLNGTCVPLACDPSCAAAYPGCASCDTSGSAPAWKGLCGTGTTCNTTTDTCVEVTRTLHAELAQPGLPLAGPFPTGYAVTAACLKCHASAAVEVMSSAHWMWAGPTPDLVSIIDLVTPANPGTVGKPFELMRGRQAVYVDADRGFVINPNVFGPGSFWGVVQAPGFDYGTYQYDAGTAAGQASVDKLWGKILSARSATFTRIPPRARRSSPA